ncbi:MAG: bifunctional (p)ppGpp synthetase/guanosine-3',5'-bis(diphosphate) 3'-pyrophosphohydrolase [Firmicutes bacterium]|nr:bifunctional (p)ppGpp synthetase/guanosine-3',5'-bis(diphosphate) 3'-pyrophosphohydrolase [Bacillota bacterium]
MLTAQPAPEEKPAAGAGAAEKQAGPGGVNSGELDKLLGEIRTYDPGANTELVRKAYLFARKAHAGQLRDSGESYFAHPVGVAEILAQLELDEVTIAAGLLHDVLEDTPVTLEQLRQEFGPEVASLVDGVTKLSQIQVQSREERQAENLRKMFLAMANDLRVVMIKLADRLHNMRTLRYLPEERQKKVARETLEIYTPLCHRLGMWRLKWEMEDLALRYLDPEAYYNLVHLVNQKRQEREGYIQDIIATLRRRLAEMGIEAEVQGRPKHFYSIYNKMKTQGKSFAEILDLMAVRIIVGTVKDCYGVLGLVHTLWKPIPGRFKDYIAMPKSNMYQSLHTTVVGPKGFPVEIQIRTREMHRTAEYGIAAHWRYKEGRAENDEYEEKLAWLRQIMEWQKDLKDVHEFMETLKIDLFTDEVYVFTPKGDVKALPAGSTPVDFAYAVHTDVGHRCIGAKVNGRIVPLNYVLRNGEFVEIITGKNSGPSQDWLGFVKTSRARSKIRQWLKEQRREESSAKGRGLLERECERHALDAGDVLKPEKLLEVARRYGFGQPEDLLASVGFGRITALQVLGKLVGDRELAERRHELRLRQHREKMQAAANRARHALPPGIRVLGEDNVLVRISRCCNPVPGDPIVGFVTRGRGISVHRADCPNVRYLQEEPERRIEVSWDTDAVAGSQSYPVEIEVEAVDRQNLLSNLMDSLSEMQTSVGAVNARTTRNHLALINLTVSIRNLEHMQMLMQKLQRVDGVRNVHRANPT